MQHSSRDAYGRSGSASRNPVWEQIRPLRNSSASGATLPTDHSNITQHPEMPGWTHLLLQGPLFCHGLCVLDTRGFTLFPIFFLDFFSTFMHHVVSRRVHSRVSSWAHAGGLARQSAKRSLKIALPAPSDALPVASSHTENFPDQCGSLPTHSAHYKKCERFSETRS